MPAERLADDLEAKTSTATNTSTIAADNNTWRTEKPERTGSGILRTGSSWKMLRDFAAAVIANTTITKEKYALLSAFHVGVVSNVKPHYTRHPTGTSQTKGTSVCRPNSYRGRNRRRGVGNSISWCHILGRTSVPLSSTTAHLLGLQHIGFCLGNAHRRRPNPATDSTLPPPPLLTGMQRLIACTAPYPTICLGLSWYFVCSQTLLG